MLYGPSVSVHLVDIDAGDPPVLGVIRQQIHKIHVGEYVVADGDDPMDNNMCARMRRLHAGEVFAERGPSVRNQRVVLSPFNAAPPRRVDRCGGGGDFALPAAYRRDRECLPAFVPTAKAAITAPPIVTNRAQGPSTPAL